MFMLRGSMKKSKFYILLTIYRFEHHISRPARYDHLLYPIRQRRKLHHYLWNSHAHIDQNLNRPCPPNSFCSDRSVRQTKSDHGYCCHRPHKLSRWAQQQLHGIFLAANLVIRSRNHLPPSIWPICKKVINFHVIFAGDAYFSTFPQLSSTQPPIT